MTWPRVPVNPAFKSTTYSAYLHPMATTDVPGCVYPQRAGHADRHPRHAVKCSTSGRTQVEGEASEALEASADLLAQGRLAAGRPSRACSRPRCHVGRAERGLGVPLMRGVRTAV